MKAIVLLAILGCAAAQGSSSSSAQEKPIELPLMQRAMAVKPNQPADKEMATLLAQAYFQYHLGSCGYPSEAVDKGKYWRFTTLVGISARRGPEIRVDKRTGTTSAKRLPTVKDPAAYYSKPSTWPYWLERAMKHP